MTVFKSDGSFIKRISLPAGPSFVEAVIKNSLPASILSYLTTTYPHYVFEKAYSVKVNNTLQGYMIAIGANNTKYVLLFDASGDFLSVRTIW